MSIEEIKTEIEQMTTKSISEVIAFAIQVRNARDPASKTSSEGLSEPSISDGVYKGKESTVTAGPPDMDF